MNILYQASFSGTPLMSELHEMFPDLHDTAIEEAVRVCEGDIEVAVSSLLDHSKYLHHYIKFHVWDYQYILVIA